MWRRLQWSDPGLVHTSCAWTDMCYQAAHSLQRVAWGSGSPSRRRGPLPALTPTHGGGLQFSSRHQPPRHGQGGPGGGGGAKKFSPFWGHVRIPHFILSILNIHKWGKIRFYHSQEMKNSTVFQQMYLKGFPASRRRHVARHSLTHCEPFECKQVGGNQVSCKFSGLKTNFRAPTWAASSSQVLTSMGWGSRGGGVGGVGGGVGVRPHR